GAVESLKLSKATVEDRKRYYQGLRAVGINPDERTAMEISLSSGVVRAASQAIIALGGMLQLIPDFTISVGTDLSTKTTFGGANIGGAVRAGGEALGVVPTALDTAAAWIVTKAQYDRRNQEWDFQIGQAE